MDSHFSEGILRPKKELEETREHDCIHSGISNRNAVNELRLHIHLVERGTCTIYLLRSPLSNENFCPTPIVFADCVLAYQPST
jgi:hypothetical protein